MLVISMVVIKHYEIGNEILVSTGGQSNGTKSHWIWNHKQLWTKIHCCNGWSDFGDPTTKIGFWLTNKSNT